MGGVAAARRAVEVHVEAWGPDDLALLTRLVGEPAMMDHLGGVESAAKIAERQARYQRPGSGQLRIEAGPERTPVGWVGTWERSWRGAAVYEIGWAVVPEWQGRGIASAATAQAVALAAAQGTLRHVHAFPGIHNAASNAVCRKVGFTLLGPCQFEYPPGHVAISNDWRYDLRG